MSDFPDPAVEAAAAVHEADRDRPVRPEWLTAELSNLNLEDSLQPAHESYDISDLYPGDIWLVKANDGTTLCRSVLILNAVMSDGMLQVALLSNEVDFAADDDMILDPKSTGIPYQLMIETQLHGSVQWSQAERRIGMISEPLLDLVLGFIWGERPDDLELLRGLPYPDNTQEPLISFRREELSEFQRITRGHSHGYSKPALALITTLRDLEALKEDRDH